MIGTSNVFIGAVLMSLLLASPARSECHVVVQGAQQVWQCDMPQMPPPPPPPPKCQIMNGVLLCTAPIDGNTRPSNCGFRRDGKYACWDP